MNNEKEKTPRTRAPRGHGPGAVGEKPKNFKVALLKMKKYLSKLMPLIIIAVILSAISSILSIVGPNKIKDLTNEISEYIDAKKLETKETESLQEQKTEELVNLKEKMSDLDKSFYTNSMTFSKDDFEGFDELEKSVKKSSFVKTFLIINQI